MSITSVMNDVSTFYLEGGGFVLPMQKSEGVMSGGVCPRGFCPEEVLSYILFVDIQFNIA